MTIFEPSPGVARESAVSAIIAALNSFHQGGTWALQSAKTAPQGMGTIYTSLVFAVGSSYPDTDARRLVRIDVMEV